VNLYRTEQEGDSTCRTKGQCTGKDNAIVPFRESLSPVGRGKEEA